MGNLLCATQKHRELNHPRLPSSRPDNDIHRRSSSSFFGIGAKRPETRSLPSSAAASHETTRLPYSSSTSSFIFSKFPSSTSDGKTQRQPSTTYQHQPSNSSQGARQIGISDHNYKKKKYQYIPDNFSTLDQVTAALRESGLESSNLILGIDFTKSNEWTGMVSFNKRSLHKIGDEPNPYEKAISILGRTLAPFDEDNLIPCFGFGDVTTHDQHVFSFHSDHSPCHGFQEVLECYRKIVPHLILSGPTSYGPVIDAAVDIVENNGGQYHVLVIIADGQVTRSIDTSDRELSPQEQKTINAIVNASSYPLSIILVGVGDGPWEDMKSFDDRIPAREFDNFQFVNFTAIMSISTTSPEKDTAFALAALMEIPIQFKAAREFGLLGRVTRKAKKIVPKPSPIPHTRPAASLPRGTSSISASTQEDRNQACPVCLTNAKDLAFGCGHMTCQECGSRLSACPICRQTISSRLRLFSG